MCMDGDTKRSEPAADDSDVPWHVPRSLDSSAADLRAGRVEDASSLLARLETRLEEYLTQKREAPVSPEG